MTPDQEQEFTAFVRERGTALLRYARLLVPDRAEAEDALQVCLLRLCRHWSRQLESPEAYVRAALLNAAKDGTRRRHLVPVPAVADREPPAREGDPAVAVAARAELDRVLSALPPRQRATVVLRVVEGLSEAETAAVMRCSPGTVKSNLARGLDKARALLALEADTTEGSVR